MPPHRQSEPGELSEPRLLILGRPPSPTPVDLGLTGSVLGGVVELSTFGAVTGVHMGQLLKGPRQVGVEPDASETRL